MIEPEVMSADDRLETPKQLASRVGISERQVRQLLQTHQLEHVFIGCRILIPIGAFSRFLDANRVKQCQDETRDRDFAGSPSAGATTSPGPSEAAAASAALARATAEKLKSNSRNGSRSELGVLRTAINWAHKDGRITRSVPVPLPEGGQSRERWLTRSEAAGLIRAARTRKARLHMPLFILLGLYTGRRKEAILSLRWPQVDLEGGLIDFDIAGRARTKKRRGKVRIPARLLP